MRNRSIVNPFNIEKKLSVRKKNKLFNDLNQITIFDVLNDLNKNDMN